jgi:hypothetical protein
VRAACTRHRGRHLLRGSRRSAPAALLATIALAPLAGCGSGPASPAAANSAAARTSSLSARLCNGSATLCARRINEVVFPATHNSMSATGEGFRFANQATGIAAQLRGGIRGLLIDTHPGVRTDRGVYTVLSRDKKSREKIEAAIGSKATLVAEGIRAGLNYRGGAPAVYLCHGYCEIGASPAIEQFEVIRDFLVDHPGEVLLISVEDGTSPRAFARAVEQSGLLPLVWQGSFDPLPTLGAMVSSDHRVLFMVEENPGDVPWLHAQFELTQETRYDFRDTAQLLGSGGCARNRGPSTAPLFLLNMFVDSFPPTTKAPEVLNQTNTIVEHARACSRVRHRVPNLIAVDQWQLGNVVSAARELNEQPATAPAPGAPAPPGGP